MYYIPKRFLLPDRTFQRFLFTDIFIKGDNIGLVSIVYPDENIDFNKIICEVNGKEYFFTHQIINRIYESNVFLMTESLELSRIIHRSNCINCKIKYLNYENEYDVYKMVIPDNKIVITTLFKDDYYLLKMWIDYYTLLGVDYFILYYNKVIDDRLREMVSEYKNILMVEWDMIHKLPEILYKDNRVKIVDNRLEKNHHQAQPMSMCHCLNFLGSKSKWIGFFDLDEYIILKDMFNLKKLLDEYNYSETAAIKFQCRWAKLDKCVIENEDPKNSFNILKKYNTFMKIETEGTFFRTKVIVNPNLTTVCNVHRLKKYKKGTREIILNIDNFYFLHYFNINCGWGGRDKRNPFKGTVNLTLENRIHQLIKYNENII